MYHFNGTRLSFRKIITVLSVTLLVIAIGYWLEHHVTAIEKLLSDLGHWAGLGFIVLFVVLTPFFFSVDLLCVIAGALFSLGGAISYVLLATMLGAAVIFWLGRNLARDKALQVLDSHPGLAGYAHLIDDNGFKIMFLLRLLPFPFALLSYLFSVSRTRFMPYWLATLGIFPYNAALTYFGFMAAHVTDQLKQGEDYSGPHNILLLGGVMACVLMLALIAKIARSELARLSTESEGSLAD